MKIWIIICLSWLGVRVVTASPISTSDIKISKLFSTVNEDLPLKKLSARQYRNVVSALSELKELEDRPKSAHEQSESIAQIISSFSSFEQMMRAGFRYKELEIPSPSIELDKSEILVYRTLATKVIYPEYDIFLKLVDGLRFELRYQGKLITESKRARAQNECFSSGHMNLACLYSKSIPELIIKKLNTLKVRGSRGWNVQLISDAFLKLTLKGQNVTKIVNTDQFFFDAATYMMGQKTHEDFFIDCLNAKKDFRTWEIVSATHCRSVWRNLYTDGNVDPEVMAIFNRLMTSSDSQVMIYLDSFVQEVLADPTACNERCVEKKLSSWASHRQFNSKQLADLGESLNSNWVELRK